MLKKVSYILAGAVLVVLVGTGIWYGLKERNERATAAALTKINKLSDSKPAELTGARADVMAAYAKESNPAIKREYALAVATSVQAEDPKQAIEWYQKAASHLEDAYTYRNMGLAAQAAGDKPKAADAFGKALAIMERSAHSDEEYEILKQLLAEVKK